MQALLALISLPNRCDVVVAMMIMVVVVMVVVVVVVVVAVTAAVTKRNGYMTRQPLKEQWSGKC